MPIQMPPALQSRMHSQRAQGTRWAVCLVGVFFLSACQSQTPTQKPVVLPTAPAPAAPALSKEAALQKRITDEVGAARCESDAQCRTLALGAKACGGPQAWLAWSTSTSRETELHALAEELAALQRQRLTQSGMVSNCRYIADPGAMCQSQKCVLRTPSSAQ